eukprot:TRINITY_DN2754_c0_g1_i1.p1 TRINITY_DN2754_c0_g1~~TRINITY_DN2754_c0_g1_i1.p1  ORF type:complete len:202 (-),score=28.80 TRINITY_DN2754_c0_g1_i1:320-925(-)
MILAMEITLKLIHSYDFRMGGRRVTKASVKSSTKISSSIDTHVSLPPQTIFQFPPIPEICLIILNLLEIDDLLAIVRLSRTWKQFCEHSFDCNRLWWKICMNHWYQDGGFPKISNADLKKKNWRQAFLRLTPRTPELVGRPRIAGPKVNHTEEWEQEAAEPSKDEMRTYYKSIRSKPKGKRCDKRGGSTNHWSITANEECF